jgi:uncharacterized protein YjbI with pentapeptide repeats
MALPMPGRSLFLPLLSALLMALAMVLPIGGHQIQTAVAAMDVAKQVLIGADFHGADLQGGTFNLTNLREADFSGADLRLASLFGAKLQEANLRGADLREATLDSAILKGTDLRDAWLENAFAFNTRFEDVRIEGADFTNVDLRGDARKALCAVASGTHPISHRLTRDTLNCP